MQNGLPEIVPVVIVFETQVLMKRFTPLSGTLIFGFVFLTRILYFIPLVDDDGIKAEIGDTEPEPITVDVEKLPDESESSATKYPVNVPVVVNGTATEYDVFAQNGLPKIVPVVIVFVIQLLIETFTPLSVPATKGVVFFIRIL